MAHDVFIAYSRRDQGAADAVVSALERASIRCWVAPRDVAPGVDWSGAAEQAMRDARAVVVILSAASNSSRAVTGEIEQAIGLSLPLIVFRTEDVSLRGLAGLQALDAFEGPLERHIPRLVQTVRRALDGDAPQAEPREDGRDRRFELRAWWRAVDQPLLLSLLAALVVGVFLVAVLAPLQEKRMGLPGGYYLLRHMVYVAAATVMLLGVSIATTRQVRWLAIAMAVGSIALMAALPLIGSEVNGSRRWLSLGPVALQPSAFATPSFLVAVAALAGGASRWRWLLAIGAYLLVIVLLAIEPDIGAATLLSVAFAALLLAMGVRLLWLALGSLATLTFFGAGYFSLAPATGRISSFTNPDSAESYAPTAALRALRSGGWFGTTAPAYLPDPLTDNLFAAAVSEFGLILGLALIALLGGATLRGLYRASRLQSGFAQSAAAGLMLLLGLQVVAVFGVDLALLPAKSTPLPFMSYGGSALIATALAMGMALALLRDSPQSGAAA